MDYSLRELECFTAVAEELSFTRAARRLHLAQPPLSRHIRALEEKIGGQLFDRSGRSVVITDAGRTFYKETRHILPQLLRAAEMARRSALGETARLNLGFVSAVLDAGFIEALRQFRERHPSVQIMLHDSPPAEQLQSIEQGTLDGGFVGLMPQEHRDEIKFIPWRKERLICLLAADHRLADKRRVALAELAQESFVAVSSASAPAFSSYIHEACQKAGFRPRIILESSRAQAVAVMVAAGSGIALLPESLAQVTGLATSAVALKEVIAITHVFAHAAASRSVALQQFVRLLKR